MIMKYRGTNGLYHDYLVNVDEGSIRIPGEEIFKLVDTHGLPLDIINLELRDKGSFFDVWGFIRAALNAGWTKNRTYNTLLASSPHSNDEGFCDKLEFMVNLVYTK
jgi:alanyl-tRNA synthetase